MNRNLARLDLLAQLPDYGAGTDVLAFVFAVQHRTAGDDDRRDVATGRAHQQRRRGLVPADQHHPPTQRIAAEGFFDVHAGQIARQHGGRTQVGLAVGKHRKLHRETACFDDAALDVFSDLAEVRIAWRQFGPGVADADNRLALKLVIGNTLILHPAAVHEAILVGCTEPCCRTQRALLVDSHLLIQWNNAVATSRCGDADQNRLQTSTFAATPSCRILIIYFCYRRRRTRLPTTPGL